MCSAMVKKKTMIIIKAAGQSSHVRVHTRRVLYSIIIICRVYSVVCGLCDTAAAVGVMD